MTPTRLVVALAGAALAGFVFVALAASAPRLSGANNIGVAGAIAQLAQGRRLCQRDELVPGGTAKVRFYVGPADRPTTALRVAVYPGAGAVPRVGVARNAPPGFVAAPIEPVARTLAAATVCVTNLTSAPLLVGGADGAPGPRATVSGRPVAGRARIDYQRAGDESWLDLTPALERRVGYAKSRAFGPWTLWLAAALVALAAGGAVALLVHRRYPG